MPIIRRTILSMTAFGVCLITLRTFSRLCEPLDVKHKFTKLITPRLTPTHKTHITLPHLQHYYHVLPSVHLLHDKQVDYSEYLQINIFNLYFISYPYFRRRKSFTASLCSPHISHANSERYSLYFVLYKFFTRFSVSWTAV